MQKGVVYLELARDCNLTCYSLKKHVNMLMF